MVFEDYRSYIGRYDTAKSGLTCLWNFVLHYKEEFIGTYRKPCPKPRQLLARLPPLIDNRDFVAKLVAISRTGACLDFALGAAKLVEDVFGYETRVINFIGWDHAIPEVKVDKWYVIDAVYTTPNYPVEVSDYIEHLKRYYPAICRNLRGLIDLDTGKDLSEEHGLRIGS